MKFPPLCKVEICSPPPWGSLTPSFPFLSPRERFRLMEAVQALLKGIPLAKKKKKCSSWILHSEHGTPLASPTHILVTLINIII